MMIPALLPALDRATLTPLVRQALGSATAEVIDWTISPLHSSPGPRPQRSVYRVAGTARDGGGARSWALALKVLRGPQPGSPGHDPGHWAYWPREPLAYQSGLLDQLDGGLRAPRCFGVVTGPEDTIALWLEDLTPYGGEVWPVARYGLAARHVGLFHGATLARPPLPILSWLTPAGLRSRTEEFVARLPEVHDPATWAQPLVRRAFPDPVRDPLLRVGAEREMFLAALARLPQTLCHRDLWRGNLFAGRDAAGQAQTIAIDWALVGLGALGEDISLLVWVSLLEFLVPLREAARLEDAVYYGYLAGLEATGWRGDPRLVRFAYTANAALQWGLFPDALAAALDASDQTALEQFYGRPLPAILDTWGEIAYLVLDRAAEARELLWLVR